MSVPAHDNQPFDSINTFLEGIYNCFCILALLHIESVRSSFVPQTLELCIAILAAYAPATNPASILTTVRIEHD